MMSGIPPFAMAICRDGKNLNRRNEFAPLFSGLLSFSVCTHLCVSVFVSCEAFVLLLQ